MLLTLSLSLLNGPELVLDECGAFRSPWPPASLGRPAAHAEACTGQHKVFPASPPFVGNETGDSSRFLARASRVGQQFRSQGGTSQKFHPLTGS